MKKITLFAVMICVNAALIAQEVESYSFKSKNGHEVLPQEGNWAIGVSATSFLQYVGNMASGATTTNNAPTFGNGNGPSVLNGQHNLGGAAFLGKYMLSSKTAVRVRFLANAYSETRREYVAKNSLIINPLAPEFAEDEYTRGVSNFAIGAGLEKRKGNGRLQGIYGAELFVGFLSENRTVSYGNAMNADFTSPNSFNFFGNINNLGGVNYSRTTESNLGNTFYAGARGYVGVEYFVAPRISIGGEVGYSFAFAYNGEASRTDETFDPGSLSAVKVETKLKRNNNLSTFGLGLDNLNAGLNLFFYF